ncbi:MAG: GT4 family glycosyltransferase PelF [Sulfobacillus thermotolerans]|nr:GT4 family glycosyltransferase PelF [Sulfobacillus thermotolerans]
MARPQVLLATEGTYPFHQGGVSTWCDTLVHRLTDVDFIIFAVAMNPYVETLFDMPGNVLRTVAVPLWGMQDPSEHRDDLAYSEIFLQKQRTGSQQIHALFLPVFQQFLDGLTHDEPGQIGPALARLYRYFRTYDYQTTFKAQEVWDTYKTWVLATTRRGYWNNPSVFESVQGLGWIYHFLTILNTAIPSTDIIHSSAAAFCGMVGIVSKLEYGTPYLLTEHGVYLREQYLAIGRSNMTPFSKRFLIGLVKAISRENLFWADELVPVCHFNGRWERVLGANPEKIRVIYNGVSAARFSPRPTTPPAHKSPLEVLAVARIDPNKDLETLLRAVKLVTSFNIPVHVRILGSVTVPEYEQKLLSLREQLGLGQIVEFLGHHDNVSDAYRAADITVQSSITEAFPYSVLESMMSGVPMVATDVGGTREALGSAGILVPSRDPAQLALGIAALAQDDGMRRQLGTLARQRALQYFEISNTIAAFSSLYRRWQSPETEHLTPRGSPDPTDATRSFALLSVTRGLALTRLRAWQPALMQFEEALKVLGMHPAAIPVLMEMATVEMQLGLTREAEQHLLKSRLIEAYHDRESSSAG